MRVIDKRNLEGRETSTNKLNSFCHACCHVTGVLLRSLYPASCHRSALFGSRWATAISCALAGKIIMAFQSHLPHHFAQYHSSDCNDVAAMTPILDLCIAAAFKWLGIFLSPTATLQDMLKIILRDSWSGPRVTLAKQLLVHSKGYLSSWTLLYAHWISI